jgi:hypothetical protein
MTFDELWRLNLNLSRHLPFVDSAYKQEAVGLIAEAGQNPNELLLTADDCVFLSAVGIRP